MSTESMEKPDNRVEDIKKAKELIADSDLLSRDEFTMETADNNFVVNGDEVDPGHWIADRLAFLEDDQKNGPGATELPKRVLKDFEARKGN
jgi:hypothetical protein